MQKVPTTIGSERGSDAIVKRPKIGLIGTNWGDMDIASYRLGWLAEVASATLAVVGAEFGAEVAAGRGRPAPVSPALSRFATGEGCGTGDWPGLGIGAPAGIGIGPCSFWVGWVSRAAS